MMRGMMHDMDFAQRMRAARDAAGLSRAKVTWKIRDYLPVADYVEQDVIRRIESGETPEAEVRPLLLAAMARVYGVEPAHLSGIGAQAIDVVRQLVLVGGPPGPDEASDVDVRASGYNVPVASVTPLRMVA